MHNIIYSLSIGQLGNWTLVSSYSIILFVILCVVLSIISYIVQIIKLRMVGWGVLGFAVWVYTVTRKNVVANHSHRQYSRRLGEKTELHNKKKLKNIM